MGHDQDHAMDDTTNHTACTDNTDLNVSITAHGLAPKLSGVTSQYLSGNGSWLALPSGGMTEAFISLYRTNAFDMAAANTWYDFPWNVASGCKKNITHDAAGANPEQLILPAGTYVFTYRLAADNAGVSGYYSARLLDDGVEIPGSHVVGTRCYISPVTEPVIAFVAADSVIELQVSTTIAGADIVSADVGAAPTNNPCAVLSILKISDDTS